MKYFIDTEFIVQRDILQLISLGIYAEDGRTFYAESNEFCIEKLNSWLWKRVVPHLKFYEKSSWQENHLEEITGKNLITERKVEMLGNRKEISKELIKWIGIKFSNPPEFWGWYSQTDWVLFCWIFGKDIMALPEPWPKYCNEISQLPENYPNPSKTGREHNALDDAIWHYQIYKIRTL